MMIIATTDSMGSNPKIVTVLASHPVVFAPNMKVNAIGSKIPASRIVMKMPIIFCSIAIRIWLVCDQVTVTWSFYSPPF